MLATEVASTGSLSPTGGAVVQEFSTKTLDTCVRQKQLFLGAWRRAQSEAQDLRVEGNPVARGLKLRPLILCLVSAGQVEKRADSRRHPDASHLKLHESA